MSYVYVRDMKSFLLSGQETALSLTARAVSTVLHDRPELFRSEQINLEQKENKQNEIYAFPLPNYIKLDGNLQDWGEQENQGVVYQAVIEDTTLEPSTSLSVKHLLGYHGRYIYAFFDITDNNVLLRKKEFLRVDTSDHVRLTIQNPNVGIKRYTLSARKEGRMSIYLMDKEWRYPVTGQPNYNLAAEMQLTDNGYLIELRIPRYMMSSDSRIKLSVADVDNEETREIDQLIATTPKTEEDDFSQIIVHTPEIAKILQALNRSDTRIWVLDNEKRVRAVVGNLVNTENNLLTKDTIPALPKTAKEYLEYARYYYNRFLQKIFNLIIEKPHTEFSDHDSSTQQRNDAILDKAISGVNATERRASLDNQGTILMSAHPIWSADKILGAVVVEQSGNQVLNKQRQVLENIISVTLLVLVTVVISLLTFASRLTLRIRRLRNATDNAIDRDGRILTAKLTAEARAGDEIGDLSRSVSNMLGRLSQYTNYLEGLPDTLAHEVSNPLNVVNSSLHNISEQFVGAGKSKYMERAQNGINRIGSILTNLTEAANLEQAMQTEDREVFDVVELVENYVEGYQSSHPDQEFELDILAQPLKIEGTPDHIAQMLDKLVDNALDFAANSTPIIVRTRLLEEFAAIDVINQGSSLPKGMAERIFEPLVSVGRKDAQKLRLGMGLYIVKLITRFHGGDVTARNLKIKKGVVFTVTLPLVDPLSTRVAPKF